MDEKYSEELSILHDPSVFHEAVRCGIRCLDSKTAVPKGDHLKERIRSHEYKVYWPLQLRELRQARGISDDEFLSELGSELYPPAKNDFPKRCLHSERKRLLVRELSYSEMVVLKSIIGRYVDHMVHNPGCFLQTILCVVRVANVSSSGIFHLRKQSDYSYIAVQSVVFPQISHEILHKFLLNMNGISPAKASLFGADTIQDFTLDHELAMNPKERKVVLDQMERDVNLLQSLNLCGYSILYVIAKREKAYLLQLPGAPYGPEVDNTIALDRRDTIPHRHDLAYGAHATLAQLIPVPYKNYEFMEREYFFGIVDMLVVDDFRDWQRSVHNFRDTVKAGPPPESCGDATAAEKYAFSFMNFIRNRLMPNYSLEDSDQGSAFSDFEDPF